MQGYTKENDAKEDFFPDNAGFRFSVFEKKSTFPVRWKIVRKQASAVARSLSVGGSSPHRAALIFPAGLAPGRRAAETVPQQTGGGELWEPPEVRRSTGRVSSRWG